MSTFTKLNYVVSHRMRSPIDRDTEYGGICKHGEDQSSSFKELFHAHAWQQRQLEERSGLPKLHSIVLTPEEAY